MITIDIIPTDRLLAHRIVLAQTIERIAMEIERINILLANGTATQDDKALLVHLVECSMPMAVLAFRLHMEGSGSLSTMYRDADAVTIQTIALDFLRTIQMVEQDMINQRAR